MTIGCSASLVAEASGVGGSFGTGGLDSGIIVVVGVESGGLPVDFDDGSGIAMGISVVGLTGGVFNLSKSILLSESAAGGIVGGGANSGGLAGWQATNTEELMAAASASSLIPII